MLKILLFLLAFCPLSLADTVSTPQPWTISSSNLSYSKGNVTVGYSTTSHNIAVTTGSFSFSKLPNPTIAPTCTANGVGILNGSYNYYYTYVTATGETSLSPACTVAPSSQQVQVSNIGISTSPLVTGRNIYRSLVGGVNSSNIYLLQSLSDNTTTNAFDNASDNSILPNALGKEIFNSSRSNTTGGVFKTGGLTYENLGENEVLLGQDSAGGTCINCLILGNQTGQLNINSYGLTLAGFHAGQGILRVNDGTTAFGGYALGNIEGKNDNTANVGNAAFGWSALRSVIGGYGNTSMGVYSQYGMGQAGNVGTISAVSDYSGTVAGTVKITVAGHNLVSGLSVEIYGTGGYDGVYNVNVIDTNNFYITALFTANESAGDVSLAPYSIGNTGFGDYVGRNTQLAYNNTWLGHQAGYSNTGTNGYTPAALHYSGCIGANCQVGLNNTLVIGGSNWDVGSSEVAIGLDEDRPIYDLTMGGDSARIWGMGHNPTTTSNGNDLTIQGGSATENGAITPTGMSSTPTAGGTNYHVGDIFNITCSATNATGTVVLISAGGVATQISLLSQGSACTVASGTATTGGSGTGLTVNITAVLASTNKNGGNLNLKPGIATGNGTGGVINLYTQPTGSSGTVDTTPTLEGTVSPTGTNLVHQITAPAFNGSSFIPVNCQLFTASGTWTQPNANITRVYIREIGGGGASYSGSSTGGGAGEYTEAPDAVSGNVTVTVGQGGGASGSSPASNGTASSFAGSITISANPGGGASTGVQGTGGTGGTNTNGFSIPGQAGSTLTNSWAGNVYGPSYGFGAVAGSNAGNNGMVQVCY